MNRIPIESLSYDPTADDRVQVLGGVKLGSIALDIQAGTFGGRSEINSPQKDNEDAFSITAYTDPTAVVLTVLDGASSIVPIEGLQGSGARYASHYLKLLLDNSETAHRPGELVRINHALGKHLGLYDGSPHFASLDVNDGNSLPASTATLIRILPDSNRIEGEHISDSWAMATLRDGSTKLLTRNDHKAKDTEILKFMHAIAIERGITLSEARKDPRVDKAIIAMHHGSRNKSDGTGSGILNGDPNIARYVQTFELPLHEVNTILLATDGGKPVDLDEENADDRLEMFDLIKDMGVSGLLKVVRRSQDFDAARRHLRYEHSDDGTAIAVTFNHQDI